MSDHQTCPDLFSATSSAGSPDGPSPCAAPASPTATPSPRRLALASRSQPRVYGKGSTTTATSGRYSSGSSESAAFHMLLANRLRTLCGSAGSTVYVTTWSQKDTPSGRRYWEHSARVRRTSDSASTGPLSGVPEGWATPLARDVKGAGRESTLPTVTPLAGYPAPTGHESLPSRPGHTLTGWMTPTAHNAKCQSGEGFSADLFRQTALTGWQTPLASDAKQPGESSAGFGTDLFRQAPLAGYPTPTSGDMCGSKPGRTADTGMPLREAAALTAGWFTPAASNANGGPMPFRPGAKKPHDLQLRDQAHWVARSIPTSGATLSEYIALIIKHARLNPAFSRWLQGFPAVWDTAAILAHRNMSTPRRKPTPCASKATATPSTSAPPPCSSGRS